MKGTDFQPSGIFTGAIALPHLVSVPFCWKLKPVGFGKMPNAHGVLLSSPSFQLANVSAAFFHSNRIYELTWCGRFLLTRQHLFIIGAHKE
jgi:hypothetical protein